MVTAEQLRGYGLNELVYIRRTPGGNAWTVCSADGIEMAWWLNRDIAEAACRQYDLSPQWLH